MTGGEVRHWEVWSQHDSPITKPQNHINGIWWKKKQTCDHNLLLIILLWGKGSDCQLSLANWNASFNCSLSDRRKTWLQFLPVNISPHSKKRDFQIWHSDFFFLLFSRTVLTSELWRSHICFTGKFHKRMFVLLRLHRKEEFTNCMPEKAYWHSFWVTPSHIKMKNSRKTRVRPYDTIEQ